MFWAFLGRNAACVVPLLSGAPLGIVRSDLNTEPSPGLSRQLDTGRNIFTEDCPRWADTCRRWLSLNPWHSSLPFAFERDAGHRRSSVGFCRKPPMSGSSASSKRIGATRSSESSSLKRDRAGPRPIAFSRRTLTIEALDVTSCMDQRRKFAKLP